MSTLPWNVSCWIISAHRDEREMNLVCENYIWTKSREDNCISVIYLTEIMWRHMLKWLINNEFENIWKEAVVT
jgi:predicted SAM-dependent methyltransferase